MLNRGTNINVVSTKKTLIERRDLALLTSSEAGHMIAAALGDTVIVRSWEIHRVHHRPGAGVSVGYTVAIDEQTSPGVYERRDIYIVATTATLPDTARVAILQSGNTRVAVWTHPNDPYLPSLRTACDPNALADLLGSPCTVDLRAYRPTRRAVAFITFPDGRSAYAKVLTSDAAAKVRHNFALLAQANVPVPRIMFDDGDGLIITAKARGHSLWEHMAGNPCEGILEELDSLLSSLPAAVLDLPHRKTWADRPHHYAHAAASVFPDLETRAEALADGIEELSLAARPTSIVPTHGDFYEANVFFDPVTSKVSCLLDVDGLAPGYREDDWACLLGHLSIAPLAASSHYHHVRGLAQKWFAELSTRYSPVFLAARTAGVVLSLVAGAARFDGGEWESLAAARLAVAESWLAEARIAAKNPAAITGR